MISIEAIPHPRLRYGAFASTFPAPLGEIPPLDWLAELLEVGADAPLERAEDVRTAVRDMLRLAGYKPTGRGKPASEYLVRAATEGALEPINLAVDACNVVSLHSGLPISVVDLDRARPPFRIAVGSIGEAYVFNASGQAIELAGLLCLYDREGACANAVKDSQRTKTAAATRRTLSIVWGCVGQEDRLARALEWYHSLLERAGGATEVVR